MRNNIPFPAEKIKWFREKLGIEEFEFDRIENFKIDFIRQKADFSQYFFDYFNKIGETAFLLTHQEHGKHLKKIWENWKQPMNSWHSWLTWAKVRKMK